MPAPLSAGNFPVRGNKIIAWVVVILTVILLWKFVDYRMQPPPPGIVAGEKM